MESKEARCLERILQEKTVKRVYLRKMHAQVFEEYIMIVFSDGSIIGIGSNEMNDGIWLEDYKDDE